MSQVKRVVVDRIISVDTAKSLEGEFIPEYILEKTSIIDYDADVYNTDNQLIAKFRKNVIPPELCMLARDNFLKAAKTSYNRGTAAGPIDISRLPKDVYELRPMRDHEKGVKNTKNWTYYIRKDGSDAKNQLSNASQSGLLGFYEKARGLPCRLTGYTRDYFDRFKAGIPFFQHISQLFQELVPDRYQCQSNRANETPDFIIPGTVFSTVTVNKNFRTGIHKDAGDFEAGFGNLTCISENYSGCHTIFPEWGVGFNVRTGDFLAMDVHQYHGNSTLVPLSNDYLRLTFVCYLRKGMHLCKGAKVDNN